MSNESTVTDSKHLTVLTNSLKDAAHALNEHGTSKKTKKESILRKNSSTNSRKKSNRNQNSSDVVKCITPTLRFPRPSPLHDRLRDSALNLVVGTLGFQGSGKSTVLSSLASLTSNKNNIFKAQSKKKRFMCSHETLGVRSVRAKEYHSH